jgi:endonuclease-3
VNKQEKIILIGELLLSYYGKTKTESRDPIEELVTTILSQNTNDGNRDRAYRCLIDRFGSLEKVAKASANEIAQAIKVGGLHNQKSLRIKNLLTQVMRQRGSLDMSFLAGLPLQEAMNWLLSFTGVGKKTAGIVMLFSFNQPYFPVDTHIKRVTKRLGIVGSTEDPHNRMNDLLPPNPEVMQQLHMHLIRLGREICHPSKPDCVNCPLVEHCPSSTKP